MAFALQEAELWSYMTGARKIPREIPLPSNKTIEGGAVLEETEERLDMQVQRDIELLEVEEKLRRVVGRIGKMCTDDVQQELPIDERPSEPRKVENKRSLGTKFKEIDYEKCKLIEEYGSVVQDIKAEITDENQNR
ncbi:hypothetical protein MMC22_008659 [Lobaria immixta]|nr:hypothetical protein [Lobaria immixta]